MSKLSAKTTSHNEVSQKIIDIIQPIELLRHGGTAFLSAKMRDKKAHVFLQRKR
jgi:hypothetical protein